MLCMLSTRSSASPKGLGTSKLPSTKLRNTCPLWTPSFSHLQGMKSGCRSLCSLWLFNWWTYHSRCDQLQGKITGIVKLDCQCVQHLENILSLLMLCCGSTLQLDPIYLKLLYIISKELLSFYLLILTGMYSMPILSLEGAWCLILTFCLSIAPDNFSSVYNLKGVAALINAYYCAPNFHSPFDLSWLQLLLGRGSFLVLI